VTILLQAQQLSGSTLCARSQTFAQQQSLKPANKTRCRPPEQPNHSPEARDPGGLGKASQTECLSIGRDVKAQSRAHECSTSRQFGVRSSDPCAVMLPTHRNAQPNLANKPLVAHANCGSDGLEENPDIALAHSSKEPRDLRPRTPDSRSSGTAKPRAGQKRSAADSTEAPLGKPTTT
jgi:hypothetical protein